jgi:hypothetical protein
MSSSSGLPSAWTYEHDVCICQLDSRGYALPDIVLKLRELFPELHGEVIRQSVLERRLLVLDHSGEDYFSRSVSEFRWANQI